MQRFGALSSRPPIGSLGLGETPAAIIQSIEGLDLRNRNMPHAKRATVGHPLWATHFNETSKSSHALCPEPSGSPAPQPLTASARSGSPWNAQVIRGDRKVRREQGLAIPLPTQHDVLERELQCLPGACSTTDCHNVESQCLRYRRFLTEPLGSSVSLWKMCLKQQRKW